MTAEELVFTIFYLRYHWVGYTVTTTKKKKMLPISYKMLSVVWYIPDFRDVKM